MIETNIPSGLERRREDYRLITGSGRYVDDLRSPEERPPAWYMLARRSPYAHAESKGIPMDEARVLPGTIAAFQSADLVSNQPLIESMPLPIPGLKKPARKPLAIDRVRYVGDPVAFVLAENLYTALAARELVAADYET